MGVAGYLDGLGKGRRVGATELEDCGVLEGTLLKESVERRERKKEFTQTVRNKEIAWDLSVAFLLDTPYSPPLILLILLSINNSISRNHFTPKLHPRTYEPAHVPEVTVGVFHHGG